MNAIASTWREVRDLLNKATDEQLDKPIKELSETKHVQCTISVLCEDLYDDGDYITGESELSEDFDKSGETPVYKKGDFLISSDQ